jgi:2-dehydro-3-deoxyphosphogluconate aldolase/(4S)-4-hydroxy-2-oxoglutarate aldolase
MNALQRISTTKLIVISRGLPAEQAIPVANALLEGGVRALEITLNTPRALHIIAALAETYGNQLALGAGTVLDLDEARQAVDAGAQYLVCPHTDVEIIEFARLRQIPVFPGALTPTEIVTAWKAGATAVKLFPTGERTLELLQELRGPLSAIPFITMGGVTAETVGAHLKQQVFAVGVGSAILHPTAIAAADYQAVTQRAASFVRAMQVAN